MKDKILQLNKLYSSALSLADEILKLLFSYHIENALSFNNQIPSRIDGELIYRNYPIPVITCRLHGYKTQIGFDLATATNYLGFIKFTLAKNEILKFNFAKLNHFEFSVYSTDNHQFFDSMDTKERKNNIKNSKSREFRIKIDFSSPSQIEEIIRKMSVKRRGFFYAAHYTCACGSYITVNSQKGRCPVCGKESSFKRIYRSCKCPVCKTNCIKDQYGNGECNNCGWKFDVLGEKMKNDVLFPNLISLNKAKQLYKEGKPFKPNLNEYMEMLYVYSEVVFSYKNKDFCLFLIHDKNKELSKIEFSWGPNDDEVAYFKDKEDFIKNAKIDNEYVRDIWNKVENPCYL